MCVYNLPGHARSEERKKVQSKRKMLKPQNVYALNNMFYEWLLLKIHFDLNAARCYACAVNKCTSMNSSLRCSVSAKLHFSSNFSCLCAIWYSSQSQMLKNCTSSFKHLMQMSERASVSLYREQSNMQHSISHLLKLWCINLCAHYANIASIKWAQSNKRAFTEQWALSTQT